MKLTTMYDLQKRAKAMKGGGVVVRYKSFVFATDASWQGGFWAKVYDFVDKPEESGECESDCLIGIICTAEETFPDAGSALKWCFAQVE